MLETSLFESNGSAKTRKPATVLLSTALHGIIVAVLLLVPLAQPQSLPMLSAAIGLPIPIVSAKPEPQPQIVPSAPAVQQQIIPDPEAFIAPQQIPADIARVIDDPAAAIAVSAAMNRGNVGTLLRTIVDTSDPTAPPIPPPPAPAPAPAAVAAPIRVGGQLQAANLIHQVAPVYPPIARTAHVQGLVILEAVISKDGVVQDIRVVKGHPLLDQSAIDAVQQWRYRPTILNGEPVEVITTVTVNFVLQ